MLWFPVFPSAAIRTMKINPPKFSWFVYCTFVLIVSLPPMAAWYSGKGSLGYWLTTAFYAGSAYWGIYALWWIAAILGRLPPRPRR